MKPYGRSDGNVSENRRWASQIYGRALRHGPAEPVPAWAAAQSAAASLSNARKSAENFLDFAACACYNTQAAANIRSGIEVVITALTRNHVISP